MSQLYAKLRTRESKCKYRKVLSTSKDIYQTLNNLIEESLPYDPDTILDDGAWYRIEAFSKTSFAIEIITEKFDSVDFESLAAHEFKQINFVFVQDDGNLYFQNVGRSRLVGKKGIIHIGERFEYDEGYAAIPINDSPDAIYIEKSDVLYFHKLSAITGIFNGIDLLYRQATQEETVAFLENDFINLIGDFSAKEVKTPNRKRIALATDTLSHLGADEKTKVFSYIGEYCPDLNPNGNSFDIKNEDDLQMLLYGIQQRFYTTQVGGERRIANSIIKMDQEKQQIER